MVSGRGIFDRERINCYNFIHERVALLIVNLTSKIPRTFELHGTVVNEGDRNIRLRSLRIILYYTWGKRRNVQGTGFVPLHQNPSTATRNRNTCLY